MQTNQIILVSPEDLQRMIETAVTNVLQKIQPEQQELLSFKEVCALLQISASTLFKWKAENRIPYKQMGKRVFFNRSEVIAALEDAGLYKKQKNIGVSNE